MPNQQLQRAIAEERTFNIIQSSRTLPKCIWGLDYTNYSLFQCVWVIDFSHLILWPKCVAKVKPSWLQPEYVLFVNLNNVFIINLKYMFTSLDGCEE
jgi:hypothetical protein